MFESRGLPDYPPPRNAWEYPPPPISRRWKWVAILAGLAGLAGGSSLLVTAIVLGTSGAPGIIDDEDLIRVIERECRTMTESVESTRLIGSLPQQARAIQQQNRAVSRMVSAIERGRAQAIREDRPTEQWLADWRAIVEARNRFVLELVENGAASFDMPLDPDGVPVNVRMEDAWLAESSCDVPSVLVSPYPDDSSDV
ncbi:hypothetical protein C6I20_08250 [Aeromicrobium sp. A1-2]|uniref:hypothetical protein n=1 Tax=Aeromicrobium sp. A1-2 TaxID=2107713 RepID=UPI000E5189B3|nr:hypothetical protein [Aeromicrobium sp. A1-2]AXT85178.1 hypothetical protein C6I20_08250 [Aeromicrobium sp. A1-2]